MDYKLREVLEQIESSGELRDPDSTKYAKTALITRASRRGLIAWSRRRARYELTAAGRKRLARARAGKGTWSISAKSAKVIGMTVAAGVLGAMVFYAGAFHQMFRGPTSAGATVPATAEVESSATPEPVPVKAAAAQPASSQGREAQPARVDEPVRSAAAPAAVPTPAAPVAIAPAAPAPQPVGATPAAAAPAAQPAEVAGAEQGAAPPAAAPASPPVATGAEGVPQTAGPEVAAAPPDPALQATGHRKRQHARHHHRKRNDFGTAFASLNTFAQRLFAPPPRHARRRQ